MEIIRVLYQIYKPPPHGPPPPKGVSTIYGSAGGGGGGGGNHRGGGGGWGFFLGGGGVKPGRGGGRFGVCFMGGGVYALRQYSTAVRNTILLKAARINILCNDFLLFSFFASNFLMKITLLRPGVMLGLHRFFNHENYEDRMRLCLKKTAIFVVTNVLAPGFEGKKRG